jgi:hypothetical protein
MDHHFRCGASGQAEGFEDKYTYGKSANGIYIPSYSNIGSDKRDYVRGFGYQGGGSRSETGMPKLLNLLLVAILKTR